MPTALKDIGYHTAMIGKNHFDSRTQYYIKHGYETMKLYDGIPNKKDDYYNWFVEEKPGFTPTDNIPASADGG